MEELIHQSEPLSKLHPQSVNTLRINTVNYGNGNVEVKWPCLRIGKGDSIVDNAGAGGIFGAVNVDTGTIVACSDEFHHEFTEHPDTKMGLVGFQIPFWKAACDLVKNAALLLPEAKFIGWDLALTDDGYVLVEGNYGPILLYQIATGVGIKKEFDEMQQRLGVC